MTDLRSRIRQAIEVGMGVEGIDADILSRAVGLSDERRAALWLYAWHLDKDRARLADESSSHRPGREARRRSLVAPLSHGGPA